MNDIRIAAENLSKRFLHHANGPHQRWRKFASWRWGAPSPDKTFWALTNVSFSVVAGEMLGVIGSNGAGKSTLLCLLGGIAEPTSGRVSINGRLGALLELGGGFVDDLTGRENAILAGVIAGLTRAEVRARLHQIVAFAEISDFIDEPVRTYSTGMRMRLAFSVAVHTDPEILLVDEFLAVGDLTFQAKCRGRIAELRANGCAIVVVSHGLADVRETCDRVLWLRHGMVAALDTPQVVTDLYEAEMRQRTEQLTPASHRHIAPIGKTGGSEGRIGSMEMEIIRVSLESGPIFESGGFFELEIDYVAVRPIAAPIFGVSITKEDGTVCLDTNTESAGDVTDRLTSSGSVRFSIERLELGAGRYFVNVGIFEANWSHAYDYHWHTYPLLVDGAKGHKGVMAPACRWNAVSQESVVSRLP